MPREKKVVVGLELKDKEFLKGLSSITAEVKKVGIAVATMTRATGGDFSQLAQKIDQTKGAIGTSNTTMTKMLNVLKEIRGHMADLKSAVGSTNTQLDTLNKTAGRTETGVKGVGDSVNKVRTDLQGWQTAAVQANTATNQLAQSGNALVQANNQVAQSFHTVSSAANNNLADAQDAYQNLANKAGNVFAGLKKGKSMVGNVLDTFNPARVAEAAGWNVAYGIANAPAKLAGAIKNAVGGAIKSTQELEGEMFDLEAYLGGPNGEMLVEFGKKLGAVGSEENIKTAGMTALQNKILEIGQKSSFTAIDIAKAATAAAKAGVTIEELAGKTGTALNAINLLSQNTGESLESSATSVSKLQALFESNLNMTQKSMGKAADAGEQYQIIVDGLAAADSSSAASAQQLTEALFNVGGSASNLNVSFFETMSLVSQMVPAFESAASAGTSLKYVFSGISGGRSVKAKSAMKQLGLMDAVGQSVFFDEKGFVGIEKMTEKLREVFGEKSGMAVDVKNRIITDIFGQDALKAVARMVSMTDEQAQEMYKMAADMTSNAAAGVRSAESIADIKNEGLEYDIEFFKGTLDSLQKTLTMPLMKPMSNIVQTFSGIGNAMALVMTDAANLDKDMADTRKEFIDTSLLPGAGALFDTAAKYAVNLREVIKIIGKDGFTIDSISKALASLFGASGKELDTQGERFKVLLTKIYGAVEAFIKNLPTLLEQVGKFTVFGFEQMGTAMMWIIDNWDSLLNGFKLMLGLMAVDKVASFTNNILDLGVALGSVAQTSSKMGGFFANMLSITQPTSGSGKGIAGLLQKLAGGAATAAPAAAQLNMFAPATAAVAGQLGMMTKLMGLWTGLSTAVGGFVAPLATAVGWTNLLTGAVGALLSPLGLIVIAIGLFIAAWQTNAAGIQEFIYERFGGIATYIMSFGEILSTAFSRIVGLFSSAATSISQSSFMNGIAEIFKGVVQILEGFVLIFGGVFKIAIGILSADVNLMANGFVDIGTAVMSILGGLARGALGIVEGAVLAVIDILNFGLEKIGLEKIDTSGITKFFDSGTDIMTYGTKTANEYSAGFKKGIENNTEKTAKVVSTFIKKSTIDPVTNTLLIKSPSWVMYNFGNMVVQGYVNGIVDSTPKVVNAMATMNDVVINSVRETGKAVQKEFTKDFGRNAFKAPTNVGLENTEQNWLNEKLNSAPRYIYNSPLDTRVTATQSRFGYSEAQNVISSSTKNNVVGKPTSLMGMTSAERNALILQNTPQFTEKYGPDVSPKRLEEIVTNIFAKAYPNHNAEQIKAIRNRNGALGATGSTVDNDIETILGQLNVGTSAAGVATGGRTADWQNSTAYKDAVEKIYKKTGMTMDDGTKQFAPRATGISKAELNYYDKTTKILEAVKKAGLTTAKEITVMNDKYTQMGYKGKKYFDTTTGQAYYMSNAADDYSGLVGGQIPASEVETKATVGLGIEETKELTHSIQTVAAKMGKLGDETKLWTNASMKWLREQSGATVSVVKAVLNTRVDEARTKGAEVASTTKGGDDITRYTGGAATREGQTTETRPKTWDPYNYNEWITRGTENKRSDFLQPYSTSTTTYRQMSGQKARDKNAKQEYVAVNQLPQAASFFSDQLVPEQYDSEFGDVSTAVAGFKMQYGDAGVKFHGLTDTFQNTPGLTEQYAQVGNRAATFLSLKKGQKMTAEDYAEFQRLMGLDRADKERYLTAASTLQTELNKVDKDPTLTTAQKATKKSKLVQGMQWDNTSMTGSYRDILGVKVGNLGDYDTSVSEGEVTGDTKTYADTAFQRVREGIATAVDPKNQSAAFKALTPEEQDKLKKAVGDLPLAASAYLGQAMMDGVMTNDERILMEMYSTQDAERLGAILAAGVMPTQADIDAGFQPYVDGTATFTKRENIVGTVAESYLAGYDNLIAGAGTAHGQLWTTNFVKGVGTDKEGNKIDVGQMSVMDIISLDPVKIKEMGIAVGTSIPEGVAQGIIDGSTEVDTVITDYYGPGGVFEKRIVSKPNGIDSSSPSALYAEKVGKPMVEGVALGIKDNAHLVSEALSAAVGASSPAIPAAASSGIGGFGVGSQGAAAAGAAPLDPASPFFLMGRQSATQFIAGFFNEQAAAESLFHTLYYKLQLGFTPDAKNADAILLFTAASDLGRLLARKVVDVGFSEYIDNKEGKSDWTFNTVLANALGNASLGTGADGWAIPAGKLGENIAKGIAAGMNNEAALKAIHDAACALIQKAVAAGETCAVIESPSKLFADKIGAPISAGVAMGIGDNSNLVDKAIGGVVSSPVQRNYQPDISAVALAGRRQAAISQISNEYNYNLGVQTNQSPQLVQRSFAVMSAFQGE